MRVYVASGIISYEGSEVLEVFTSELAAGDFMLSCVEHDEKEPEMPHPDAGDAPWFEYENAYKEWRESHPAKKACFDSYSFKMFTVRES